MTLLIPNYHSLSNEHKKKVLILVKLFQFYEVFLFSRGWHQNLASNFFLLLWKKLMPNFNATRSTKCSVDFTKKNVNFTNKIVNFTFAAVNEGQFHAKSRNLRIQKFCVDFTKKLLYLLILASILSNIFHRAYYKIIYFRKIFAKQKL